MPAQACRRHESLRPRRPTCTAPRLQSRSACCTVSACRSGPARGRNPRRLQMAAKASHCWQLFSARKQVVRSVALTERNQCAKPGDPPPPSRPFTKMSRAASHACAVGRSAPVASRRPGHESRVCLRKCAGRSGANHCVRWRHSQPERARGCRPAFAGPSAHQTSFECVVGPEPRRWSKIRGAPVGQGRARQSISSSRRASSAGTRRVTEDVEQAFRRRSAAAGSWPSRRKQLFDGAAWVFCGADLGDNRRRA